MHSGARHFPQLLGVLLLLGLTGLVFRPATEGGFVNWDDDVYVTANPLADPGAPFAPGRILTSYVSGNYHPLTVALLAAERRLHGDDARPYHVLSLALHLVNALLVWRLLAALGTPHAGAFAGALLWAVHPARAEAVAWISGRKDLLAALFSLGAILAYLAWRSRRRARDRALSPALHLGALLSKGTAVALPAALLCCDLLQGRRLGREALRDKLPHLALAAAFGVIALLARRSYQGVLGEDLGTAATVAQALRRAAFYFLPRSVALVDDPTLLYPGLSAGGHPLLAWQALAAAALLGAVGVLVALTLRRTRKVAFGVGFFAVTILPALPVTTLGYSADRFTYLPAVGLAFLAGEGVAWAVNPGGRFVRWRRGAAALAVAAALVLLARETRERTAAWADSASLWSAAIERYREHGEAGRNLAFARRYRGRALALEGRVAEALRDYDEAVGLDPGDAELLVERGVLRAQEGLAADAIGDFTAALELAPGSSAAAFDRGLVHLELGDAAAALRDFTLALSADPGNASARLGRGRALLALGEAEEALREADALLARHPGSAEAHALRGGALAARGRTTPPSVR